MVVKYRFLINELLVNPLINDDTALESEMGTTAGQRFLRESLSGTIVLVRQDFELIHAQPFETEFVFKIQKSTDMGLSWVDRWQGTFYKTDVKWDLDNLRAEFSVTPKDEYVEVLAGLDKEYDLVKLAPEKRPMLVQRRPIIQVYLAGDNKISNFILGNTWEQDVTAEVSLESDLTDKYHFSRACYLQRASITGAGAPQDLVGDFVYSGFDVDITPPYNVYLMHRTANSEELLPYYIVPKTGDYYLMLITASPRSMNLVRRVGASVEDHIILFSKQLGESDPVRDVNMTLTAVEGSGASGTLNLYWSAYRVHVRVVTNSTTYGGFSTSGIPIDDIVEKNPNYKYVTPYVGLHTYPYSMPNILLTNYIQWQPTEYGLTENASGYFVRPTGVYAYFPVGRSRWANSAIWFTYTSDDVSDEPTGRTTYTIRDCTTLRSTISVLLREIAPTITFEESTVYSIFFFSYLNPLSGDNFELYLTPKSNVTVGEYDQPAKQAAITLGELLTSLWNMFQVCWFIDNGKFRIEHISWFKNGGSYGVNKVFAADLTTLQNPKNKKVWGYNSSKYEYDKGALPERYEFSWADEVSSGFKGFPIEISSKFVQRGKIDEQRTANITTDIDYMVMNASSIGGDGFAMFAVQDTSMGTSQVIYKSFEIDNADFALQNGFLSWLYLHLNFWRHDLPTPTVKLNNTLLPALGLKRTKKQVVKYPSVETPSGFKLIKTYLGDGEMSKISVNLSSAKNEITLLYDTQ